VLKEPTFSFIIPVYKKPPEVFEKCLKSLFDMSLKDIEVICVFDGPDSELYDIAKRYDTQAIVIEHGGAPKARNAGFKLATGKYVVWWDADCYAKPNMAARWLQEFEAVPEADFVYTGYEFAGERGGEDSEPFDAYSLTCGNFISTMSPIKREKAPVWDETLEAGQDWDFWWTAVEQGCKGAFIEGPGFITDTIRTGLSSDHWRGDKREETIRRIREKHGVTNREIGVYSLNYRDRAIKLAKILGGDVIKKNGPDPAQYRVVINFGYSQISRFEGFPESTVKVQYWIPTEIEALAEARYSVVMETIRIAKRVKNLCNTIYEKNKLADLGINAEVVPLPISEDDISKAKTTLPEEFAVLVLADESYGELLKEISIDLPYIKFGFNVGKVSDYSCVLSFYRFAALDEPVVVACVNGRHVISNIQAPFCGFVDPDQTWDIFKKELYEQIRLARGKPYNQAARDYYLDLVNPEKFRAYVNKLLTPTLEVVS